MGFKRYGVDHYVPGTEAGVITESVQTVSHAGSYSGAGTVTTFRDNDYISTKTDEYNQLRDEKMLRQLKMVDSNIIFDDYFHLASIKFITTGDRISEEGSYDVTEEEYLSDFIELLQEWVVDDRDVYTVDHLTLNETTYPTLQSALRDTIATVFGLSGNQQSGFVARALSIMNRFSLTGISLSGSGLTVDVGLLNIYDDVVGDWHTLSDKSKLGYIKFFWSKIEDSGAFDYLSDSDLNKLEENWPVIADMIFRLVDSNADYGYEEGVYEDTMSITGTLAYNVSRIMLNHYPEVALAWLRSADSYYDNETSEYNIIADNSVSGPSADAISLIADGSDPTALAAGEMTSFPADQNVLLDIKDVRGEAIYYTVENNKNQSGNELNLFRRNITLGLNPDATTAEYKINTYAMSYGNRSNDVEYNVKILSDRHRISTSVMEDRGQGTENVVQEAIYSEGSSIILYAPVPQEKFFIKWVIKDDREQDVTEKILGSAEAASEKYISFTVPAADEENGLSEEYSLTAEAVYGDRISSIEVAFAAPEAGELLAKHFTVSWGNEESQSRRDEGISWLLTADTGETIVAAGEAFNSASYTASLRIKQDEYMMVLPDVEVKLKDETAGELVSAELTEDGSIDVTVRFNPTAETGGQDIPPIEMFQTITIVPRSLHLPSGQNIIGDEVVYYVQSGAEITISAPVLDNYKFSEWWTAGSKFPDIVQWENETVTYTLMDNDSDMRVGAYYYPIVRSISIDIPEPIVDSNENGIVRLATETDMRIVIDREYRIRSENVKVTWSPYPKSNQPILCQAYTAGAKLMKQGLVLEDVETGEKKEVKAALVYAEDLVVTVNGEAAVCDTENNIVYYSFGKTPTALLSFTAPEGGVEVPYGASVEEMTAQLPETAAIETVTDRNGNTVTEAAIRWESVTKDDSGLAETAPSTWTATGTIVLPDTVVNNRDLDLTVQAAISMEGAEKAPKPTASSGSGTYEESFAVLLACEAPEASICYTTDGSDPKEAGTLYAGESIKISRADAGDGSYFIRAYASVPGMQDSSEAVYDYHFTNEITVPKGKMLIYDGENQIGVRGSENYTLTVTEGDAVIDARGNVSAAEIGTYQVTASLNDPELGWSIKAEDGTVQTVKEDQVITFTIAKEGQEDPGNAPAFKTHSLLLGGQIGVNFYADLSMLTEEERSAVTVEFTVSGETITAAYDPAFTNPATGTYHGFTCPVSSIQMAEEITAVLHYGEEKTVSDTYRVLDYINYANENPDMFSGNLGALINAIADYGHYVQPFLADMRGWTIGVDYQEMPGHSTFTQDDVAAAKNGVADRVIGYDPGDAEIETVTFSLVLDTETCINLYLTMKDDYRGSVTAVSGGKNLPCEEQPDGRWLIEIGDISAHKLGDVYEVEGSAGGTFTISVSALDYVKTILNSNNSAYTSETAQFAITSIYRYYDAAVKYISTLDE